MPMKLLNTGEAHLIIHVIRGQGFVQVGINPTSGRWEAAMKQNQLYGHYCSQLCLPTKVSKSLWVLKFEELP